MKTLIITLVLCCSCIAQTQTGDVESLKQANKNLIAAYQNQKFDEALKFAKTTLKLSLKLYGAENIETATAYANLGAIYREQRNFGESAVNLKKAMEIYQKTPDKFGIQIAALHQSLADTYSADGKKKDAEDNYLKAVDLTNKLFGAETKKTLSPTLSTANFYAITRNVDKSHEFYLKSYKIAVRNFGREAKQIDEIDDAKTCTFTSLKLKESKEESKLYEDERKKIVEPSENESDGNVKIGRISGSVINGKAKFLAVPEYPSEAKKQRLTGTVPVRVLITENGDVVEAKSICGISAFSQAVEAAAKKSKFTPTTVNGVATKLSGIIIYNFTAQ